MERDGRAGESGAPCHVHKPKSVLHTKLYNSSGALRSGYLAGETSNERRKLRETWLRNEVTSSL